MTAIRWFSLNNDFIDFVIIVKDEDCPKAFDAVRRGMDLFWDGDCEPYGSCIEYELTQAGIQYAISYIPWDYKHDTAINEEEWEAWLECLSETMAYLQYHT